MVLASAQCKHKKRNKRAVVLQSVYHCNREEQKESMAPATRSQTIILRSCKLWIPGTDEDYMKMYADIMTRKRISLCNALRCTRRCLHCGRRFSRERRPRPSMAGHDDNMRFPQLFEALANVKTGQHAKTFLKQLNEAKGARCELQKVHRVCKAFEAMAERRCVFCYKWCRSSPFEYEKRLAQTHVISFESNTNVMLIRRKV